MSLGRRLCPRCLRAVNVDAEVCLCGMTQAASRNLAGAAREGFRQAVTFGRTGRIDDALDLYTQLVQQAIVQEDLRHALLFARSGLALRSDGVLLRLHQDILDLAASHRQDASKPLGERGASSASEPEYGDCPDHPGSK